MATANARTVTCTGDCIFPVFRSLSDEWSDTSSTSVTVTPYYSAPCALRMYFKSLGLTSFFNSGFGQSSSPNALATPAGLFAVGAIPPAERRFP